MAAIIIIIALIIVVISKKSDSKGKIEKEEVFMIKENEEEEKKYNPKDTNIFLVANYEISSTSKMPKYFRNIHLLLIIKNILHSYYQYGLMINK